MPEPTTIGKRLLHLRVGVEHTLTAEQLHAVEEVPSRSDRRIDLEAVFDAREEVVGTVTRSGVNRAGALFERDVVAQHCERRPIVERMLERDAFQFRTLHARDGAIERAPNDAADGLRQTLRD